MEKSYKNIVYFFIAVSVIIFIGFFKTYFGLFPNFSEVDAFHHFHAIVLISWLLLLIVQPILIRKRKYTAHRWLGRISYFLVPIMIISMLLAYKTQYERFEKMGLPHAGNLGTLFAPFTDVLPFASYYILAIRNTRNIPKHMRYIISTALIVIGSGLVRILLYLLKFSPETSFNVSSLIILLLFILFILYDKNKGKQIAKNPFTVAFLIFLIPNILSFVIPQTTGWQAIAESIAKNCF